MFNAMKSTRDAGESGAEVHRFECDDWHARIFIIGRRENGAVAAHVDLYRAGKLICRLTTARHNSDEQLAVDDLADKAVKWIDDWNSREHSGDTGFLSL